MITITDSAKKYMRTVILNGDKVSLSVKGGGCSGMHYVWGLRSDDVKQEVSWSEPIEGVLVVDPLAEMYIMGSEVDYITELGGSYLAVKNPMQVSSCGCGESFGI
jgi:iron-sulfur cluster assembly accessory protein